MPCTKFLIDDPMGRNMIRVLSRAPLKTILLQTTNVTGEIELDTDNTSQRTEIPEKMIQELARARRELGERMSRS